MTVATRVTTTLRVEITYCNGYELAHRFTGPRAIEEATADYADLLGMALEPTSEKHIRQVSLTAFDQNGESLHHVHSGIFVCSHRGWE